MNILVYDIQLDYQSLVTKKIYECFHEKDIDLRVYKYSTVNDLLSSFSKRSYQFAFVEMKVHGQKGIEVAKLIHSINPSCRIIFMSNSYRRIPDTFEVNAFDYLLKPFTTKDFQDVMDHILSWYKQQNIRFVVPIRDIHKKIVFTVDDIKYVRTSYNDIEIVTIRDDHYVTHVKNRYRIREALRPRWFIQVNSREIVNMKCIDQLIHNHAYLKTGEVFYLSKLNINENQLRFAKYIQKTKGNQLI